MRPLVSIICNTYNHERFIRSALNGFVIQDTTFPIEVLLHDDASTDHTVEIIREFEERYPKLIKPIYQKENKYSKGFPITKTFQFPRVQGKYIAFCEGDDFWTASDKLQKQIEALENNPSVDACAHKTEVEYEGKTVGFIAPKEEDCIISVEEVISGGGGFVSTNSMVYRSAILMKETPMQRIAPLDYTNQIQGSLRGGMLYLNECKAVYRKLTQGSWTRNMANNVEIQRAHIEKIEKMLYALNKYTNGQYTDIITSKIRRNRYALLETMGDFRGLLNKEYSDLFAERSIANRVLIIAKAIVQRK